MPAYVVADVERTDLERAARYAGMSGPSIDRHGDRFLARGGELHILEGDWQACCTSSELTHVGPEETGTLAPLSTALDLRTSPDNLCHMRPASDWS